MAYDGPARTIRAVHAHKYGVSYVCTAKKMFVYKCGQCMWGLISITKFGFAPKCGVCKAKIEVVYEDLVLGEAEGFTWMMK